MKKVKTPWYIWLSTPAFFFLSINTGSRIKVMKKFRFDWDGVSLWINFTIHVFVHWVGFIMLPLGFLSYLSRFLNYDGELISILVGVFYIFLLIASYLLSVYAVHRHVIWRKKNLLILQKSKDAQI